MYHTIISVACIFSVFDLKNTGCAVGNSCYRFDNLWTISPWIADLTNSLCENYCKDAAANYAYYGTSNSDCYCREAEPSESYKEGDDKCTTACQGSNEEFCGGHVGHFLITGSEIDSSVGKSCYKYDESWTYNSWNITPTNILCEKLCQEAAANNLYYGTMYDECYCRQTEPSDDTIEKIERCTARCSDNTFEICGGYHVDYRLMTVSEIDRTTETVTEKNNQATSATSVSTRASAMTDFINMITSDTSPAIATKSTTHTTRELSSTTSQNANNDISPVMTNTSTQATTANGEWSMWNDWKFCEVNCVREDTTNGTQRRWRTCNGLECSGDDMEERACSEPEICKRMRPRKLLCKCPKRLINTKWHFLDGKNITDAEVKKIVLIDFNKNIKSEMSVDKKTVSKESRKKKSSVNKRKSSQSIGWGCIVFLVLPVIFLIAIDILNCCIHFRSRYGCRKRIRIRPISNIQDQKDGTKPVQENVNVTEIYYASRCGNGFHPDEIKRETYQIRRDDNNQPNRNEWLQYI